MKSKYWIISDPHLGHNAMLEYCGRPEGFEDLILGNLVSLIKPEDILICLGDFCMYRDGYWHDQLINIPCKKWLIRGNHDRKSLGWYLSHGWDFVGDSVQLNIFGKNILLTHKPINWEVISWLNLDMNIHGHLHNTGHHPEYHQTPKHRCIFMEHHYKPIDLRKIAEG